jgi:hypothetical protein
VIGSAWTEWVRPIISVAVAQEQLAGGSQLERETGVDDVAAREAEVEVAPFGADRLRDLGDEGDHVVVGRLLDLGDPFRIDGGPRLECG